MRKQGTLRLVLLVIFIALCALAALIAGRLAHGNDGTGPSPCADDAGASR